MIFLLSLAFANIPEYTYIEAGEPAPFSGRLFNDEASQLLADEIADATEKCQIQMDYQIGMLLALKQEEMAKMKSDHRYEKQVLESKVSTLESRVGELEALKTPPKRQFWFVTGLVSGIALTISIAKAVE